MFLILVNSAAHAHFTHFEPRVVHIYQHGKDINILLRMPFPLLILSRDWKGYDKSQSLPFSNVDGEGKEKRYILNQQELASGIDRLHLLIRNGHQVEINGRPVPFRLLAITLFNSDTRASFDTLESAQQSLKKVLHINPDALDVFDLGIDMKLSIENTDLDQVDIKIQSSLGEHLLAIERVANVVNVYRSEGKSSGTTIGVLDFNSGKLPTFSERGLLHLFDGFTHILIGLDHILFLLVLFFSCKKISQVALLATIFAIGHSISLFYSFQSNHSIEFVVWIELLIAATVFLSAISVLLGKEYHLNTTLLLIFGMIHGLGFSIVYNELYRDSGYSSVWDMVFFTFGIELGQFFLCLMALTVAQCLAYCNISKIRVSNMAYISILMISCYWVIERSVPVFD